MLAEVEEGFAQGRFKSSLKTLERFMRRNPKSVNLRFRRVEYLLRAGGIGAMIETMELTGRKALLNPSAESLPGILSKWVRTACSSKDSELRLACARALGDIGPQSDAASLKPLLAEGGEIRRAALLSLGRIRSRTAFRLLVENLPKGDVPQAAFKRAERTPAEGLLLEALDHKDADVRLEAVEILAEIGSARSLPRLRKLLGDEDGRVRGSVARVIGGMRDPKDRNTLEKMMIEDGDEHARAGAAAGLGTLYDKASVPILWKVFTDKAAPMRVRAEAAFALSGFRPSEDSESPALSLGQVAALRRAYQKPQLQDEVARFAITAGEMGEKRAALRMREALLHEDKYVRKAAGLLLYQQEDTSVVPFLASRLEQAVSPEELRRALRAIREWQSGDAVPLVMGFVSNPKAKMSERIDALRIISELGEVGQKVTLQVAAEARAEPALRVAALDLLCDLQVEGALAMVRKMLPSESGAIQVAAMRAFSRLGNKELASEARSLVEQLGGKAVPIKDSGGKEVEGQHTPLLIHAAAALARWQ